MPWPPRARLTSDCGSVASTSTRGRTRAAKAGGDRVDRPLGRGGWAPQRQRARRSARQRAGALAQRVRRAQDLARALQEVFALGGEVQTAADAVEERQAQLALEVAD